MDKKKVLIFSSGSVACLKIPVLVNKLKEKEYEVQVIVTEHALHFLEVEHKMPNDVKILTDDIEWCSWKTRGDPVMHIELMRWADLLLIAPLSANTLAKLSQGLCDNLGTCVARAWPIKKKPLVFCPAMNTNMWEHPVTLEQIHKLKDWGCKDIPCISKTLVCGDTGLGAMAEVDTIVETVSALL